MALSSKIARYRGLVRSVSNWPAYLAWKATSPSRAFAFEVRGLGTVEVGGRALGPFRENFFDDVYFRDLPAAVAGAIPAAPVVLDVGANNGYFALATFVKFPDAKIVSLEPHPYCVARLREFRARFPAFDWAVDDVALADTDGDGTLKTDRPDEFSSMATLRASVPKSHAIPIRLRRLDAVLDAHGLAWVDLAKFDCEGGEYPALYGASDAALARMRLLCIETHKDPTPRHNRAHLNAFLRARGFTTADTRESREADHLFAWRE